MKKGNKIIFNGIIGTIILCGYYFLNRKYNVVIPCLFYKITNLYCPGCGITRMLFSLLNFKIYQAFRYNPLVFCLIVIFIFYKLIAIIIYKLFKRQLKINSKIYNFLLILVLGFGILRNIPYFNFLKPTIIFNT